MIINEQDAGRTVAIAPGEVVTVQLSEQPTTGYRWSVESAGDLELVDDHFTPAGQRLGAGGVREFSFRAPAPGAYDLLLHRRRSWQGNAPAATFAVTLDAR